MRVHGQLEPQQCCGRDASMEPAERGCWEASERRGLTWDAQAQRWKQSALGRGRSILECGDEQVMEPATASADLTSLPSTTVGSHGSGSQTDRGWGNLGRKPP